MTRLLHPRHTISLVGIVAAIALGAFALPIQTTAQEATENPPATESTPTPEAQAAFETGVTAFEAGDYDAAIDAFTEAIALSPDYVDAYVQRARSNIETLNFDRAYIDLDRAVELDPHSIEAWRVKAETFFEFGSNELAFAALNEGVEANPDSAEMLQLRAFWLNRRMQSDAALLDMNRVIALDPTNTEAWVLRADIQNRLHETEAAIESVNQALALDPTLADALSLRANLYDIGAEYGLAIADLSTLLQDNPTSSIYLRRRADAYLRLDENENALADYDAAIENTDDSYDLRILYEARGHLYNYDLHDYEAALADYQRSQEFDPDYNGLIDDTGYAYFGLGDYDAAIAQFDQMLELYPDDPHYLISRSAAYYQSDRPEQGLADCAAAFAGQDAIGVVEPQVFPAEDGAQATIDEPWEHVHFLLDGQAGDVVTLETNTAEDTQLDTLMLILGPDGEPLACKDDIEDGNLNSRVEALELPEDGEYTIIIGSPDGRDYDTFTLHVATETP